MNCANCGQPIDERSRFCGRCGRPSPTHRPAREGDEAPVVPLRLDDVLEGKWRLERKVGEGGMGSVYQARDLQLDRPVAVKLLSSQLLGDAELMARFEREAKLTASLEHPNIVPVYAVGRHEGRPFMVMKMLEGQALSALLHEKKGLSLEETLALARQLASGLDHIHQRGFIHRDIKSGNIMVGPEGRATLLDFGILRPAGGQPLTRTGVVMGTPQYMSPEQALGAKEVDHRADLYALAVVLFECLAGALPFEAESELELIQLQAHAPPPDLRQRAPWVSPAVAEVMARALSKRAEDRFPSAAELVAALEAAAGGKAQEHPSLAALTAPSWRQRGKQPPSVPLPTLRRSRAPWVISLLSLAALGGAAFALFQEPPRPEPVALPPMLGAEDAGAEDLDAGQTLALLPQEADAGEPAVSQPEPDRDAGPVPIKPRRKARYSQVNVITTHKGERIWAEVKVNGQPKGRTPLTLELPEGRHRIRVERAGFRPNEREIVVASGRPDVLRIRLSR